MIAETPHLTNCQNYLKPTESYKAKTKSKVFSSFGALTNSKQTSAPKYSFGKSTREEHPKRYISKQISKGDNFGVFTPKGPDFDGDDRHITSKSPSWKMTTTPRMKLDTQARYQYYHMPDDVSLKVFLARFDRKQKESEAQIPKYRFWNITQSNNPLIKFETERSRSPGPEYYPGLKGENKKQPAYSLAMKRKVKGDDPILVVRGTDEMVGPGTYRPQKNLYTSRSPEKPKWTFPQSQRNQYKSSTSLYQTYDVGSSMGKQVVSKQSTRPKYTIHGSRRSTSPGILKTEMQFQPMKVNIAHPRF